MWGRVAGHEIMGFPADGVIFPDPATSCSRIAVHPSQHRVSQVALVVKNPLANAYDVRHETWVAFLGGKDTLEEEMATHSSILACRIP